MRGRSSSLAFACLARQLPSPVEGIRFALFFFRCRVPPNRKGSEKDEPQHCSVLCVSLRNQPERGLKPTEPTSARAMTDLVGSDDHVVEAAQDAELVIEELSKARVPGQAVVFGGGFSNNFFFKGLSIWGVPNNDL